MTTNPSSFLPIAICFVMLAGSGCGTQRSHIANPPGIHANTPQGADGINPAQVIVEDYYAAMQRARTENDPVLRAAYIEEYVDKGVALVNVYCSRWFEQIYALQRAATYRDSTVSVLSQLGTTLLGVAKASSNVVTAYGAGNTVYAGVSENMQSQYLLAPTSKNVEEHIRTLLAQSEKDLRKSTAATTSFAKAYNQLEAYGRICTYETAKRIVDGALQATKSSQDPDSGAIKTTAITNISSYQNDEATKSLRNYWKPDGTTINSENQKRLKTWMRENGIGTDNITFFLKTEHFAEARRKAVADLELAN